MNAEDKGKAHKVIGAGIGWVLGGPVGAALGLLVGHTLQENPQILSKATGGSRLKEHYDMLQVPYSAGPKEVRAAYKRLARKYHPDRFTDSDPVLQELAKEKMTEINVAYGQIMKGLQRG